jgi:hypothetical protein
MLKKAQLKTIRRSFALPSKLIDEVLSVSTIAEQSNLNKLVTVALQEYVNNKKRREFEKSMLEMANDPEILRECGVIEKEFKQTEMDGLSKER